MALVYTHSYLCMLQASTYISGFKSIVIALTDIFKHIFHCLLCLCCSYFGSAFHLRPSPRLTARMPRRRRSPPARPPWVSLFAACAMFLTCVAVTDNSDGDDRSPRDTFSPARFALLLLFQIPLVLLPSSPIPTPDATCLGVASLQD